MRPEYQQRVIDERDELATKLDKLNAFLTTSTFRALDNEDARLLVSQGGWMTGYLNTLDARIARF